MDKAAELLANVAEKYGPHVVDAIRGATIVHGYAWIISGVALGAVAAGFGYCALRFAIAMDKEDATADQIDGCGWGAVVSGFLGVSCAGAALLILLNIWTYVAVINPDLYIAKKALGL